MAFKRYANALIAKPGVHFEQWMEEIRAQHEGAVPKDYVGRIAKSLLRKCDPTKYLLSHATIVASVDTYTPSGLKTGRKISNGIQIDVKFPDIRIKPECHKIINNNGDAWARPLLLSTYRTFIGAHNYLEHIQLPELSKGFIIDAVARDLGDTVYVDILVATDRGHNLLIGDILSGKVNALSMGCISLFTICTKCGNVAADDSQLCSCVQYEGKGSKFVDESGVTHPIAELVGHISVPNSNQFIEASWVRSPAFKGAVRRNLLNPDTEIIASKIHDAASIYELRQLFDKYDNGIKKAASTIRKAQPEDAPKDEPADAEAEDPSMDSLLEKGPDEGGDAPSGGSEDKATEDAPKDESADSDADTEVEKTPADKMKDLLEKAQEMLLDSIVKGLDKQLKPRPEDVGTIVPPSKPVPAGGVEDSLTNVVRSSEEFNRRLNHAFKGNDKLIKWASWAYKVVREGGHKAIVATGITSRDLIILSWIEDVVKSRKYSTDLYKVAMNIGSIDGYPSEVSYLAACRVKLGRVLTPEEQTFFRWKGRIASLSKF